MAAAFGTELNMISKNKFDFETPNIGNAELAETIALFANFKEQFNKKLEQYDRRFEGSHKQFWSNDRIRKVMYVIKSGMEAINSGYSRTQTEYYWMSKCDIIKKDNEEHLMFKRRSSKNKLLRIVPREKYFDILSEIHISCNHGGRHRMSIKLKNKCFIPKNVIKLFVSMCPGCQAKRLVGKNNANPRPNEAPQINAKGRVNLTNFKYCPDGEYKWLLSYQDDATKYLILRPLKTILPAEVTYELMKIFLTFGAPNVLQLDMDYYFMSTIKQEIMGMWPNCQIVPKSNSKVNECDKQELEYIIQTWMARNDSTKWSVGCYVVQYNKNNTIFGVLGSTPYKMMFGYEPRAGLSATNVPARVLGYNNDVKVQIKQEPVEVSNQIVDDKK